MAANSVFLSCVIYTVGYSLGIYYLKKEKKEKEKNHSWLVLSTEPD